MRSEFIIDGRNFSTMSGFYEEIEKILTLNLNWKIGRNLNAFNDILRGGFGRHDYEEPIFIKWLYFEKSRRDLGDDVMNDIVSVIMDTDNSGHDCILEKL